MFFDRLGDPGDVPLIESVTVRLLFGQSSQGGWTYHCPTISEGEKRRLSAHLDKQAEMVARGELPKGPLPRRTPADLPREVREQLGRMTSKTAGGKGFLDRDDNSNTQFAILGLWVSRRHGLPVDPALVRAERHFRRTQNKNGGWGYLSGANRFGTASTPAMTCAGLLGLALGHGATGEATLRTDVAKPAPGSAKAARNVITDKAVTSALALLGSAIGNPRGKPGNLQAEVFDPIVRTTPDYYFLWSLERVAMAFDLKTIGTKDWYSWGAELLLAHQDPAGSWTGKHAGGGADTSFALLFLCRSNLAQDLTSVLRGRLKDPGPVELRANAFAKEETTEQPAKSGASTTGSNRPEPGPATASSIKPPPPPSSTEDQTREVQRLTDALVRAPEGRQATVLADLVQNKGGIYTEALAAAIPQLGGEAKQKARDGLVKRLARMTAVTLRDKFKDEDIEIRRAAALAVELKGDRQLIPDLIALLEDRERPVARAAQAALKEMTRQDFGEDSARWKTWWAAQKPK
jgi:hypothetical protein